MITILLIVIGAILVSAIGALLINLKHAPEGYEDAAGFHVGQEPGLAPKRRSRSKMRRTRSAPAVPADLHLPAVSA